MDALTAMPSAPASKDTSNVLKHANLHCRRPKLSLQVDHRLNVLGAGYRRTWIAQFAACGVIGSAEGVWPVNR